ncbi:hypothetical protein RSO01_65860 [Reyranella soli]|uniref:Uncharacterized protein n=1 Tax=Reyranella soli TaxID=1230389 RepID=A0A512NKE4_9HYPH|nr:hypothetical protein RSO01_65860 [Reyranella soli]
MALIVQKVADYDLRTLRYQQAGLRGTLAARPAAHKHYLVVEARHIRFPPINDKEVWQIEKPGPTSVNVGSQQECGGGSWPVVYEV